MIFLQLLSRRNQFLITTNNWTWDFWTLFALPCGRTSHVSPGLPSEAALSSPFLQKAMFVFLLCISHVSFWSFHFLCRFHRVFPAEERFSYSQPKIQEALPVFIGIQSMLSVFDALPPRSHLRPLLCHCTWKCRIFILYEYIFFNWWALDFYFTRQESIISKEILFPPDMT